MYKTNTIFEKLNYYLDNMSEKVDMVEVKTEPNECGKLYYVYKISNMIVSNH